MTCRFLRVLSRPFAAGHRWRVPGGVGWLATGSLVLVFLLAGPQAPAQTHVWTGLLDGNWATGTNWNGGVPASGTATVVQFTTATTLATTNNIGGGLTLNQLSFGADAGARTIDGNALTFAGTTPSIVNQATAGHVTVNAPLVLSSTVSVTGGPSEPAQLFLFGAATGAGGITAVGGITVLGGFGSTYTGETRVQSGAQLGGARDGALGASSSLVVESGAHFQVIRTNAGTMTTIDRPLTLAGVLSSASKRVSVFDTPATSTYYSGAITLSGAAEIKAFGATGAGLDAVELEVSGAIGRGGNTLTLSTGGANNTVRLTSTATISGNGGLALTPNGGTLILGGAVSGNGNVTATGTGGSVTMAALGGDGGLTVALGGQGSIGISGVVSGARDVAVSSGLLSLASAANTFTGSINLSGTGRIIIPNENALGNAANTLTFTNGGQLQFTGAGNLTRTITTTGGTASLVFNANSRTVSSTISGTGGVALSNFFNQSIATLTGNNTFTGGLSIGGNVIVSFSTDANLGAAGGTIQLAGGSLSLPAGYPTLARPVEITSVHGNISGTTGASHTISGNLTGDGLLTLGGATTFTLSGTNTHAGGIALAGNTNNPTVLLLDSDARLGASTGALNLGRASGASILPGTLRATADLTIAATRSTTFRGMIVDTNGFNIVFNQPISGRDLTKTGAGTWTLNTANTDTSDDNLVTIAQGTVKLGTDNVFGTRARISSLSSGAVLDLNGRNLELMYLDNVGPTGEIKLGGGTLTLTTRAASMEGIITGSGQVVLGKEGLTSLGFSFSGNHTFTGGLTLRAGATLQIQGSNALGAAGNSLTLDNGTLSIGTLAPTPLTIDATSNLTIAAGGARFVAGGQSIVIASQLTGSNPIQFGGGSFPGEGGPYDVRLTHAANTFVGNLPLGATMLGIVADGSLGHSANVVTLGSSFFDGESTQSTRGGLRAYADLTLAAGRTIRLDGSNSSSDRGGVLDTNGHTITVAGAISQVSAEMPLLKTGAGTLLLNGANTFTGTTTVIEGTLGGTGSLAGNLELQNEATLAPGASAGLFVVAGDLTLAGTSALLMELGGTTRGSGYDAINVGGTLTADGTLTVSLINGFSPVTGSSFQLLQAGTFSGAFATVNLPSLTPGLAWDSSLLGSAGTLSVTGSAIPEPGTYALLAGCAGLAVAMGRRRRAGRSE